MKKGSKSFALASLLLPRQTQTDVAAVYAWCRRADDAIDLAPASVQPIAIERLEHELRSVYAGEPQPDEVLAEFQRTVRDRNIPSAYPFALLEGMRMDARGCRYATLEELLLYCYRVAGTVGAMMCHVLEVSDAAALRHAVHLGMAMQLTNIGRDVEEDWARGRIYVPSSFLPPGERVESRRDGLRRLGPHVASALARLLSEAKKYYRSGDRGLVYLSWRAALAVRAARLIYSSIATALSWRRYDVLAGRVVVPSAIKLLLVVVAVVLTCGELPFRIRRRFRRADIPQVIRFPADVLPV